MELPVGLHIAVARFCHVDLREVASRPSVLLEECVETLENLRLNTRGGSVGAGNGRTPS